MSKKVALVDTDYLEKLEQHLQATKLAGLAITEAAFKERQNNREDGARSVLKFLDSPLCKAWEENEEILKKWSKWEGVK